MRFEFWEDGREVGFTIPIRAELLEAISVQWMRCSTSELQLQWASRLCTALEPAIAMTLDRDLRPPTKAQVEYALAIARGLKINLPGEALLFQGAMGEFLDRYGATYKQRSPRVFPAGGNECP